jgi:hypothetical protein
MSVLAAMPFELRSEILMTADADFLNQLSPEIIDEARRVRRDHGVNDAGMPPRHRLGPSLSIGEDNAPAGSPSSGPPVLFRTFSSMEGDPRGSGPHMDRFLAMFRQHRSAGRAPAGERDEDEDAAPARPDIESLLQQLLGGRMAAPAVSAAPGTKLASTSTAVIDRVGMPLLPHVYHSALLRLLYLVNLPDQMLLERLFYHLCSYRATRRRLFAVWLALLVPAPLRTAGVLEFGWPRLTHTHALTELPSQLIGLDQDMAWMQTNRYNTLMFYIVYFAIFVYCFFSYVNRMQTNR